nr:DUF4917 family protein [uncultured Pseudodesulfovibrio sp.]
MPVITFQEAMAQAQATRVRNNPAKIHLLVGNGFSIALRPDIFTYTSLFSEANFADMPAVQGVFDRLGTTDFEEVVWALERAATILPCYQDGSDQIVGQMAEDAQAIKEILVETIAGKHPERPFDITDDQYAHCIGFLKNFLDARGKIYTLNYDILLYWALMKGKKAELGEELKLDFDDGFRSDMDDPDTPYVIWNNGESRNQNVYYLHGALHLFDAGHELRKYTWNRTNEALVDQSREAINNGMFPLFVSEGSADKKMMKIEHSGYLHKALRSFTNITGVLFIHGMSLSPNDEHILRTIERGKICKLFIGLHGDPESDRSQAIIARAENMTRRRENLEVHFYDSSSAAVWETP